MPVSHSPLTLSTALLIRGTGSRWAVTFRAHLGVALGSVFLSGPIGLILHPLSVRARPSVGLGRGRRDRWSDPLLNRSDALGGPAAPSEKKDHHETSKPTHDSPSGGS